MRIIRWTAAVLMCMCAVLFIIVGFLTIQPFLIDIEPEGNGEIVSEEIKWNYRGVWYELEYEIDVGRVEGYEHLGIPRCFSGTNCYVMTLSKDPTLKSIARDLMAMTEDFSDKERFSMISKFIDTAIYYKDDNENQFREYYRFPLETLYYRQGDCEDHAILTVALLKLMGYDAELIFAVDHALAGVNIDGSGDFALSLSGKRYLSLDTTGGLPLGYEITEDIVVVVDMDFLVVKVMLCVMMTVIALIVMRCCIIYKKE